jgi:hypothetical protein
MAATLHILEASGAAPEIETIEIGENVYLRGNTAGYRASAWDSLRTKPTWVLVIQPPLTETKQDCQLKSPSTGPIVCGYDWPVEG